MCIVFGMAGRHAATICPQDIFVDPFFANLESVARCIHCDKTFRLGDAIWDPDLELLVLPVSGLQRDADRLCARFRKPATEEVRNPTGPSLDASQWLSVRSSRI